jgi:hypothetical protein
MDPRNDEYVDAAALLGRFDHNQVILRIDQDRWDVTSAAPAEEAFPHSASPDYQTIQEADQTM